MFAIWRNSLLSSEILKYAVCVLKIPIFTNLAISSRRLEKALLKIVKSLLPCLFSLGFVVFIYSIHMSSNVDSMLNEKNTIISNGFLTSQINYHKDFAPFARRPLTTWLIETTSSWLGISMGKAFIWVNFSLLFLSGLLLYRLSMALQLGYLKGIINLILYFLSFSIIFVFFPPVFSYDEPLQYCFIFAGLTSILNKHWVGYIMWFTAAMIARENTAFVILGILFFIPDHQITQGHILDKRHLKFYFLVGLPVVFYMACILLFIENKGLWDGTQDEFQSRFSCFKENFKDLPSSVETVTSIIVSLGTFIYFLIVYSKRNNPSNMEKKFINAFILSCAVNTPIILLAAFSREVRLFSLPLVFLWPLMAQFCYQEIRLLLSFNLYPECFRNWRYSLIFLGLTLLNYLLSFRVYIPSFPSADNYFNEYLFVSFQLIIFHLLLRHSADRHPGNNTLPIWGIVNRLRKASYLP